MPKMPIMNLPFLEKFSFHGILIALVSISIICSFFIPMTADVELHFFHSVRMVEDGGLYKRWIEVMPPTLYLLYAIPVYLNKLTSLNYNYSLATFTFLISFLSVYITTISLKKNNIAPNTIRNFQLALLAIFFFSPLFTGSIFDRDMLFLIFAYPWIIHKILGLKSNLWIILFAVIGCSIKQYFYLYFVILILFSAEFNKHYLRNLFSKENFLIGFLVVLLNGFYFYQFTEYFTKLLPVLLISYKDYTDANKSLLYSMFFGCVFVSCYFFYLSKELRRFIKIYSALFLCALATLHLNTGILYNINHTISVFILILFHFLSSEKLSKKDTDTAKYLLVTIFASFAFFSPLVVYLIHSSDTDQERIDYDTKLNTYTNKPYMYINVLDFACTLNSNSGSIFDNRNHMIALDHFWMTPWLYKNLDHPKAYIVKNFVKEQLLEALQREKDVTILVAIEKQNKTLGDDFNIFEFFKKNLDLENEFKDYKKVDYFECCKGKRKTEVWKK